MSRWELGEGRLDERWANAGGLSRATYLGLLGGFFMFMRGKGWEGIEWDGKGSEGRVGNLMYIHTLVWIV